MTFILKQALTWLMSGQKVAIATVIDTWGSSPRPVGSQLILNDLGDFAGSVSGGCIEGEVIFTATEIINGADPTTLGYTVTNETALNAGLSCGGTVNVFITSLTDLDILTEICVLLESRQPFVIMSDFSSGQLSLITQEKDRDIDTALVSNCDQEIIEQAFATGKGLTDQNYFYHPMIPAPRLFITGAGHIAQALAPMAKIAGFEVIVIDPRTAFSTKERFPDTEISTEWPDKFFSRVTPDASSALVTLVHDPKIDDLALEVGLRSKMFYIGSLGSKRTHQKRTDRFLGNGFTKDELTRIHAPIGLDLGGRKPPEIAVSIIAEVVQEWNNLQKQV